MIPVSAERSFLLFVFIFLPIILIIYNKLPINLDFLMQEGLL